MKRNLIGTLGALAAGLVVSSGVATAGAVAWNIRVGGSGGNVGFGVGVATTPTLPPPPPVVIAPPCVVVAPSPVWVVPTPSPVVFVPRRHHRMHRPMGVPPAVFVAAPPLIAGRVFVNRPGVFAQPPVFRAGR